MIETQRLILRPWVEADLAPFAEMNADPEVMRYLPGVIGREQSDGFAARIRSGFEELGYGLWAVEVADGAPFIGFVGLAAARFEAHFTPAIEVGWRIAAAHQNLGYATEAAAASLEFGFGDAGLEEIVSFTVPANTASCRVMEKIGMHRDPVEDFDHPKMPPGHPLRRHVLYRAGA